MIVKNKALSVNVQELLKKVTQQDGLRSKMNKQREKNNIWTQRNIALEREKPFHDIYNALKAAVEAQAEEKENLMRDIDFFQKEIERKNKLHGNFLRIKREKCKMAFENSLLRVDFEALLFKLTANETRTRDSDFLTTGKDTASLLRDDVALKLREMKEIRERIGAMEEENDALLLAHAQELCKERPKIGPWTIQINRGARMNQRSWAYEVC
ncbi:Rho family-interacting cell polarization regulator 1 [Dissostichus eleginoides]|uniref:Rho family-interacting cell polarization regulator 1 n=1 Tax=Dissostichus eleginoides TaxID=100907 RepID=A0AAD9BK74_DISEL|nr:Rho family-interacting cell polarization regulator 1 [Dissostichus eleginoides]